MLKNLLVSSDIEIKQAVKKLDENGKQILLVVDENNLLLGVVTDGDIRRWILKSGDLSSNVTNIMNQNPTVITSDEVHNAKKVMEEKTVSAIPVVNDKNEVVDVIFWHDKFNVEFKAYADFTCPIVIMAGGKGSRLAPITNVIPKPLIPIGDEPIVERIINKFMSFGPKNFYLTINYKKNMIKAYFKDQTHDYNLSFVEEDKPLGTAGSLYLLKDEIKETFFISNCDVIINADYSQILDYHKKKKNKITMVTSLREYVIPYGVIKLAKDGTIDEIIEKPEHNYLVNTGMYILEPECFDDIPENEFFHITELIELYIKRGEKIGTFPVSKDSWLDMGEFKEMKIMQNKLL